MTVEPDQTQAVRRPFGTRMLVGLLLLAFIGGALLMTWLSMQGSPFANFGWVARGEKGEPTATSTEVAAPLPAQPMALDGQAARVADLEQRLAHIAIAAQAASYNAYRAEALLTAFATRRSLDQGKPLGYMEGMLRLRFGDAQPRAVATIINAAAAPVTLNGLQIGLQDIAVTTRTGRSGDGWWQGVWREVSGIAVLRRTSDPSPAPEQRLARARRALDIGQLDTAIAEISALPPRPVIAAWLEKARRYNEAHRALDVIEAAAILEPRGGSEQSPIGPPAAPQSPFTSEAGQ